MIRLQGSEPSDPHNLYAPFYKAYIPAAWGDVNSGRTSGVYGATFANNYASFLTQGFDMAAPTAASTANVDPSFYQHAPLYDYWQAFPLIQQDGYNNC